MTTRRSGFLRFFRSATKRTTVVQSVSAEIQHHLDMRVDVLVEEGYRRLEAEEEARRRFGDVDQIRNTCEHIGHDVESRTQRAEVFHSVIQDLRYALRGMRRSPAFAAAVILTLGLGIGANTAIFTVVDAVLIRPLPYEQPERLVNIWTVNPESQRTSPRMSLTEARTWMDDADVLEQAAAYMTQSFVRTDGPEPVSVVGRAVTIGLLDVLGVAPRIGRPFLPEDAVPGAAPVVMVSNAFWRGALAGDPAVLNRTIELDEVDFTVIGVMPANFQFPNSRLQFWVPISQDGTVAGSPVLGAEVIGRLPDGVSIEQAQERVDVLTEGYGDNPNRSSWSVRIQSHDWFRANDDVERVLWILMGAVGLMLLIAAVNGVNLMLVRGTVRAREIAVRLAIGASRGRLVRQLLAESVVLAVLGGVFAVLLARVSVTAIIGIVPSELTFFTVNKIEVGRRVLVYAFGLSVLAGLALGLVPAWRAVRAAGSTSATAMDSYGVADRRRKGLRGGLVVAEVALCMMLLVGAGLLLSSFVRLTRVDPGFNPENLVQLTLSLPAAKYQDGPQRYAFFARVKEEIAALPGVRAVALADGVPPSSAFSFGVTIEAEGKPAPSEGQPFWVPFSEVEPAFFDVLEIPIVAGRNFSVDDDPGKTVIVDTDLAHFLWGGEDPVGRRFSVVPDHPGLTVVGVIDDVKLMGRDDRRGQYDFFYPLTRGRSRSFLSLVMRTERDPSLVMPSIRSAIHRVDPNQPIFRLWTGREALADSVEKPRFLLVLMVVFAGVALALAAVGTYSVLAFSVTQQARELAIRSALGAHAANLRRMVLRGGVTLAAVGCAIGLAGALVLSRLLGTLLFEVEPTDPTTLVSVAALMILTAMAASYLPARRATQVDPIAVLKAE